MKAAGTEPPVQPRGPFLHSGETEGPCAANPPPKGEDDPLRRGGAPYSLPSDVLCLRSCHGR